MNVPSRLATAGGIVASSRLLRAGDEDVAHIREFVVRAASRAVGLGVELGEGGGETLAAGELVAKESSEMASGGRAGHAAGARGGDPRGGDGSRRERNDVARLVVGP